MRLKLSVIAVAMALGVHAHADELSEMKEVVVTGEKLQPLPDIGTVKDQDMTAKRTSTSDTASMLDEQPGVSINGAGGISSLPAIHGLADDRIRTKVDGMDLIASCPNHMNPPLSYVAPSALESLGVYAGISPVSVGGDSIGGTIVAKTKSPEFAETGEGNIAKGEAGAYYRSNNKAKGGNLAATYATEQFNISYDGSVGKADDYSAGAAFKDYEFTGRLGHTLPRDVVASTAYLTRNHMLGLAFRQDSHLLEVKMGKQDMPYQLYPNQRMDLLGNDQKSLNLRYLGQMDWGSLEARAYREMVDHFMDFGADKRYWYGTASGGSTALDGTPCAPVGTMTCANGMPMYTEGRTSGASVKADVALTQQDLFRVGIEVQSYQLNDYWTASGAMMQPYTFWNIHDGKRDRTALYGEMEQNLDSQWMTLVGVRLERVDMDAGMVHGYNQDTFPTVVATGMNNQIRDAANFNNANRSKTDKNVDMTALARYAAGESSSIEFGFAHKVRSPNVYERYTWSTWQMAALMNNFVGDGNGYLGDVNLKPEKANTLSATLDLHAPDGSWGFKATPYYTKVADYIDAVQWDGTNDIALAAPVTGSFSVLKYVNQSARLYGLDLSGRMALAENDWGTWGMTGLLNYTAGKNLDTGDELYNTMPLNGRLVLTQKQQGWDNRAELVMVKAKKNVSDMRNEIKTPGYGLVHLRGSYAWDQVRVDFGIENLLDKFYYLPTGGTYTGQGTTMTNPALPNYPQWGTAVPGMGRSIYAGLDYKF